MKKAHDQWGKKYWIYFTEKLMKVGKRIFIFCGTGSRHRHGLSLPFHTRVDGKALNCLMPEMSWISLQRNYLHFHKLHLI